MGKKQQSSASQGMQPPSTPPSTTIDSSRQPPHPPDEPPDPVIFHEGWRVSETMKRGNYIKALKMIKKSISHHQDSAQLHALEAAVCLCLAEKAAKDTREILSYLTDAVRSAELAVAKLPNSLHCANCLVVVLFEKALINGEEWDRVIQACDLALKIENPTDPGLDKFLPENDHEMVNCSKESRIECEKQMIRTYLRRSYFEREKNPMLLERPVQVVKEKCVEEEMVMELLRTKQQIETVISDWCAFKQEMSMEKSEICDEKVLKYKSFWRTLSAEEKRGFCKVSIKELERHLKSSKCHFAVNLLREAIGFGKEHKTWKSWQCHVCHWKFGNCEFYRKHCRELHWNNIDEIKSQSVISGEVIELIQNGNWKPVDADVEIMHTVNKMKSESCSTSDSGLSNEQALHENNHFSVADHVEDAISKEERMQYLSCSRNDKNVSSQTSMDDKNWRLCDDMERATILESICGIFRLLLKNKCLPPTCVHWVIQYTIQHFDHLIPFSRFLGLENIKIICLLGTSELKEVLKFLQDLTETFGLSENPEMVSSSNDKLGCDQMSSVIERVEIIEDFSCILLDRQLCRQELNLTNDFHDVAYDGSAVTSAANISKDEVPPESDDLVSWLFKGPMIREELVSWTTLRDFQRQKSMEIFRLFLEEYLLVKKICVCDYYSENSIKLKVIRVVEDIYLEEAKKRDEIAAKDYVNLLKKRQKELQGNDDIASRLESDFISNVISEILGVATLASLNNNRSGFGELCTEDELKMLEGFQSVKNFTRSTLQMMRLQPLKELAFADARILQIIGAIQQHELKLEMMSFYDYRSIIIPVLKSFLKAHLEDLFNEDAVNKYDATREALIAKIDAKNTKQVSDNVREKQDKKKRNGKKNFRKNKKSKATDCSEDFQLHQNDSEQAYNPNHEIGVSASADDKGEPSATMEKQLDDQVERKEEIKKGESSVTEEKQPDEQVEYKKETKNGESSVTEEKQLVEQVEYKKEIKNGESSVNEEKQLDEQVENKKEIEIGELSVTKEKQLDEQFDYKKEIKNGELCVTEEKQLDEQVDCKKEIKNGESSVTEEEQLDEQVEYKKDIKNEYAEKRLHADVEKAVCLSLDSFEKRYGQLPTDVRNGSTPRFDVHQYVIIQSQWWLRQLRDEFMSKSEITHTHAGNPCLLCACQDSFAAMRIASRDMPEVAFVPISSRKFPVNCFFKEWLNSEDLIHEDVENIGVSRSAYELKQQLVAEVKKVVEK